VEIRGGLYELDSALSLGEEDSGTRDARIAYSSYRGEKVILSGGKEISGFRHVMDIKVMDIQYLFNTLKVRL
jgi:hypothetical protein